MIISPRNLCVNEGIKKCWNTIATFPEYGFFKYFLGMKDDEKNIIYFCFSCTNFDKIYENGGNEFLQSEFKDFKYSIKQKIFLKEFDLVIEINIEKYEKVFEDQRYTANSEEKEKLKKEKENSEKELAIFLKNISEKIINFRKNIYSYVIKKCLLNYKQKKSFNPLSLNLNETNILHLVYSDNLANLIYCINFKDTYEQSLCDLFLKELKTFKNNDKKYFTVDLYPKSSEIPQKISSIDSVSKYSNGFAIFHLFLSGEDYLKKCLLFFVTFRENIQKHIHYAKIVLKKVAKEKGKEYNEKYKRLPNRYIEDPENKKLATQLFKNGIMKDLKNL